MKCERCGGERHYKAYGDKPDPSYLLEQHSLEECFSNVKAENVRFRAALEDITTSHPNLVTRGGGPAPWLVAKAALLNIRPEAEEVIHQWRKTEPRVAR
jgi:hypothetical protein